ncbi:MAG TPA: hypothetical protein VIW93_01660 [Candidatus Acidoferrum sp.]
MQKKGAGGHACHRSVRIGSGGKREKSGGLGSSHTIPLLYRAGCMEGMMRDPKEPFHLSTTRNDDDAPPFTSEAQFTPETVEGTTNGGTGQKTQQVSSVHSDVNGAWRSTR